MMEASGASRRKLLHKFKAQIRDKTRRTRGISLPQLIKDLTPYLIGWRGCFGSARPRVYSRIWKWRNAGDYECICGGSGRTGPIVSRNCADAAYQSSKQRLPLVRRRDTGACQATRRSNRPCALVTFDSLGLPRVYVPAEA